MSTTKFQIKESLMITTGIYISNAVLTKLASAIADLHRKTANMSMADWRKAYRERSGPRSVALSASTSQPLAP